ncbi:hypothetical protein [Pedobacter frigoris]|uniref:hypothetical protein n=1 Tax=Pedobacter frigoris TaxID=2571272 RepID=UPI0029308C2F|nr:hypothetical protein [Pedobacter frigoris]
MSTFTGGVDVSSDCVFNVFDYLDGSAHDYDFYSLSTSYNLGYTPASNGGGVSTSDIPTIGGYGGMNVYELSGSVTISVGGMTSAGERIMMTFAGATPGINHAVAVTGRVVEDGVTYVKYYDPTTGQNGRRVAGEYASLYAVGHVVD